jgi:hypothetical protein
MGFEVRGVGFEVWGLASKVRSFGFQGNVFGTFYRVRV